MTVARRSALALATIVSTGLAPPLAAQAPAATARDGQKLDLAVLVTGRDDGTRRAEFAEFLAAHFRHVGTVDYSGFTPSDADGYDVVVFDCEIRPQPGRIGLATPPKLPRDFARASVLVSGGGAILARPLGLKTDWG